MVNHTKNLMLLALIFVSAVALADVNNRPATTDKSAVTATSQGTSDGEIEATRKVRQALVDAENLSTSAKNILIVTTNGKVILKGPVASQKEAKYVYEIAKLNSPFPVDNQLTVSK